MADDWIDTLQQRGALRSHKAARKVRAMYPQGTRVRHRGGTVEGTVYRHVPLRDAQGGYLVVDWDNGVRGKLQPINAEAVREPLPPAEPAP